MKWNEEKALITALAKKSINLTTDNCNMYHDLEEIKILAENIDIGACYVDEQKYLKKIIEICKKHIIECE